MSNATLLAQVTQRWAEFVVQLSDHDLVALAEGDLTLSIIRPSLGSASNFGHPHATTAAPPRVSPSTETSSPLKAVAPRRPAGSAAPRHRPTPAAASRPTSADAEKIAIHLRQVETETEGADYLNNIRPGNDLLREIGSVLGLKLGRLRKEELVRRVLDQAIGARRKFAGLRDW
ncbi:hypothetical protein ACIBF5_18935 [Micromonospora sp. NPDC050417]|uniref:hypothetical protein n=1 Tax=Micromonospora sp. NPDC050417 TaxID=3364280 RepID=UPI0037AF1FD6